LGEFPHSVREFPNAVIKLRLRSREFPDAVAKLPERFRKFPNGFRELNGAVGEPALCLINLR
jgi:hypothetical protein